MKKQPLAWGILAAALLSGGISPVAAATGLATIAQSPADSPANREADRLFDQGLQHYKNGAFREAIAAWEVGLQRYRQTRNRQGEADCLVNLGLVYDALGQYPRAIEIQQQALTINREIGDRRGEAMALGNLGSAYYSLGQYARSIEYHEQNRSLAQNLGDRRSESVALGNLGIAYNALAQYPRAIAAYEGALALKRAIGDQNGEATLLGYLGIVYDNLGQYEQAIAQHEQALAFKRRLGNRGGEAISLGDLGSVYQSLGQYDRAIAYHEQALALKRRLGNRGGEAASLVSLGTVYHSLGQYERAIAHYDPALALVREGGNRQAEAATLGNLGSVYADLGQYPRAIAYTEQTLTIVRELGNRQEEAAALGNLGNAYLRLEQYPRALTYLQQSIALKREIGDRQGEAISLGNLSLVYDALGQVLPSIEAIEQSILLTQAIGDRLTEAMNRQNLGAIYFQHNRLAESETALRQSLERYEALQGNVGKEDRDRVSILEIQQSAYISLQRTLVAHQNMTEALAVADRSRARSLMAFLLETNPQANSQASAVLSAAEIQQVAREQNATIVHYSEVFGELYLWVVPPSGPIAFRRVPLPQERRNLAETSTHLRNSAITTRLLVASRGNDGAVGGLANRLRSSTTTATPVSPTTLRQGYDLLIKPIADLLPPTTGAKLILVPHRELALVPFAALRDEQGNFLIDRYTLAIAPSVSVLSQSVLAHAARQPSSPSGPPLIVGNPAPMPDRLIPLPGAEAEAKAIAQSLNTPALIGSQATEAALKAQMDSASLLHFATHGTIAPTAAGELDSWLALAPGGGEDGKLMIAEIFSRKLSARLAVLSACETGQGRVSGEGVVGLARAFLRAGVPTVVASLWKVPDEPTALMMQEFYAERARGKDAATALRSAMLKTREQYPGPQNWAAFVAIGDTN